MSRQFVMTIFCILACFVARQSRAETPDSFSFVRCFTDMSYVPAEGEFVGFAVILMRHRQGMTVIFEEGAGPLEPPIMVPAVLEDGEIRFELPMGKYRAGTWKGRIAGDNFIVTNTVGNKFTLRPGCR